MLEEQLLPPGPNWKSAALNPAWTNMINKPTLSETFRKNWERFTTNILDEIEPLGSSDVGNVSHAVPTIQPMISIAPEGILPHTKEFAEAGTSEKAHRALVIAAKTLAMTAIDLLTTPGIINKMKEEFKELKRGIAK